MSDHPSLPDGPVPDVTRLRALVEQFDLALDRCALYGNADKVRDNWARLRLELDALLVREAVAPQTDKDVCATCGHYRETHVDFACNGWTPASPSTNDTACKCRAFKPRDNGCRVPSCPTCAAEHARSERDRL